MVAIAILGLGLTAILSAQAGSFAAAAQARSMSVATGLARCKMVELEQKLYRDGFPELDENDSGPCCDLDDKEPMRCTWRIEKPLLPEAKLGGLDLKSGLDFSGKSSSPGGGLPGGLPGGIPGGASSAGGALGVLASLAPGGSPGDGKIGDIAQTAGAAVAQTGGVDFIAQMAMNMAYPTIKKDFEACTRRLTVAVHWTEGNKDQQLEIMQWFTKPVAPPPSASGTSTSSTGGPPGLTPGGGTPPTGLGR
jgi:general secretion pathway protein I